MVRYHTVAYGGVVEKKQRLSQRDWTGAALAALAKGGLSAVAIEPLAARLGATKGSAYWHFPNREALVAATLARWEQDATEAVIELIEREPEPLGRLRALFGSVFDHPGAARVELALLASADDPLVAPVLDRVTDRRISYLATLYGQLGFPPAAARRRAVLAYATYLGNAQLRRHAEHALPSTRAGWRAYLDDTLHALAARP
jgi:AcrR family transcriptional regulator